MSDMKLSQPKSARTINKARVLGCIRSHRDVSRAEIARILGLNKVSTGEIVDELIREGLVRETGKLDSANGRKPVCLEIVKDARFVLAVDIGRRNITVALCNLLAEPVHFERIPVNTKARKVEEFCVEIIKSCIRVTKLVDRSRIVGAGIAVGGSVSADGSMIHSCPYLPWKDIPIAEAFAQVMKIQALASNSTCALVEAEQYASMGTDLLVSDDPVIYIEWGDSVSMVQVYDGRPFGFANNFAHLKVSDKGLCNCGRIGCLDSNASAWALCGNQDMHLKDLWDNVDDNAVSSMARAIDMTVQITGSTKVVIGGEGATITDSCLARLRKACPRMEVVPSMLGDKANIMAAAEIALGRRVYMTGLLGKVKDWL